ncbi:hypothetical protein DL768_009879 [Monosporascus sp. mg162]|nr:hypothetical protein DL768_009879 [Monosporascus sp. mg162]
MASLLRLLWTLSLFGFAFYSPAKASGEATILKVNIPTHPDDHRQIIDASFQSFSIEFFAFMEYSGNSTRWSGVPIKVRIGGSSQGDVWWIPNQEQGMIGYYEPGIDKTYNVTLGPAFFDAFDAWPEDTEFVLGLPFPWEEAGFRESNIEIASRAYEKLGSRLIGLELGNERNEVDLTPPEFTQEFLKDAYPISGAVFGDRNKRIYTVGSFHAPTLIKCSDPEDETACWSVETLFENGINENDIAARADTHQATRFVDSHHDMAAQSTALGVPYILGETNSLFGHGTVNVSDTFAAALWNIDYTLYSAQTNITRLGFHQCFGWRYSAWRPIPAFGYPAGVLPSYYGYWVVQKALGANGDVGKQVEALVTYDQFTAYGIYDSKTGSLSSVIALNLLDWDSTKGEEARPAVTADFGNLRSKCCKSRTSGEPKVYRLTAPGANAKAPEAIRFGGQYIDNTEGNIHGELEYEKLGEGGKVTLRASEAVLITVC